MIKSLKRNEAKSRAYELNDKFLKKIKLLNFEKTIYCCDCDRKQLTFDTKIEL